MGTCLALVMVWTAQSPLKPPRGTQAEGPGTEQSCHVQSAGDAMTWSDPGKKTKINPELPGKEKEACL